jgi:hypothetical protein
MCICRKPEIVGVSKKKKKKKKWKLMVFICTVGTLNIQFAVYLRAMQEEMRQVWILNRTSRGWGTIVVENVW